MIGVDVAEIESLNAPNVVLVSGDVRDPATAQSVIDLLGRRADVVLSDLAPKLTGVRATDDARCAELVAATVDLLPAVLRPGGRLLAKLFMSPEHERTLARLRESFDDVMVTRPEATRRGSAELYAAGVGYRGASPA